LATVQVKKSGKWGFVDKTGKWVIKPQFKWAWGFSEGLAKVEIDGWPNEKYGYIDKTGKMVIEPQFDIAEDFSEGLATVKKYGKWEFINKTGKAVIGPQFDQFYVVCGFSEGLAAVGLRD